jgi:AcrR family transcriptional regulator
MTSLRHKPSQESTEGTPRKSAAERGTAESRDSALLDAARVCILAVGWKRTTLTDIARRANVSRMTIYRRWPDTQALLGDLLVREWSQIVAAAVPDATLDARGRITASTVAIAHSLRDNDLFSRIIELDAELLLPYLVERRGRNQDLLLALLVNQIEAGHADGSVRTGDPLLLAESVLLAAQGFVLSARTIGRAHIDSFDAELSTLIERYLQP